MIDRISPFILEILLGIAIAFLVYTYIPEEKIIKFIVDNSNILEKIYGSFIALNIAFAVSLFQEKEERFIQFLREENADKWYLNAVFFNIIILSLGVVIILFFPSFSDRTINLKIFYSILGINFIQVWTTFILWYNYIDLKRTFQSRQ